MQSEQFEIYPDDNLDTALKSCSEQLQNRIAGYEGCGSGWVIDQVHSIDTTVWLLLPVRGESWHALSEWITRTHCVLNVKNDDNRCFVHAVMASLYTPVSNKCHPSSYSKFYKEENAPTFNSLTFPMKLRDILKFEKENENKDITVSVFGVHEWKDRKNKNKKFIPDCSSNSESI